MPSGQVAQPEPVIAGLAVLAGIHGFAIQPAIARPSRARLFKLGPREVLAASQARVRRSLVEHLHLVLAPSRIAAARQAAMSLLAGEALAAAALLDRKVMGALAALRAAASRAAAAVVGRAAAGLERSGPPAAVLHRAMAVRVAIMRRERVQARAQHQALRAHPEQSAEVVAADFLRALLLSRLELEVRVRIGMQRMGLAAAALAAVGITQMLRRLRVLVAYMAAAVVARD